MTKTEIINQIWEQYVWQVDVVNRCVRKLKELGVDYYADSMVWKEDFEYSGLYHLEVDSKDCLLYEFSTTKVSKFIYLRVLNDDEQVVKELEVE